MTALAAVATYLPATSIPIEELASELGLIEMQVRVFRRYHKLAEVRWDREGTLLDLLLGATDRLDALRGNESRVRYVLHARAFPVVEPYPMNTLHELTRKLGLEHATAFTVSHQSCATGLLAIDLAGRLLAAEAADALALVLAGEKAFTLESRLIPETSVFGEGSAACLVSAAGERDRLLSYATDLRGEFDDELEEVAIRFQREYPDLLAAVLSSAVAKAGLDWPDIDLILPHNVNVASWKQVCKLLGFPRDRVLLDNVPITGHVFCADAFVNLRTAGGRGLLRPGGRYLVGAAGAGRGATFSAMVFEH